MSTIILDESLKVQDFYRPYTKESFTDQMTDKKKNWQTGLETQSQFYVEDNLLGTVYHRNFLEYLEIAWGAHRGVVISPDIIWYGLLCEVASIIKAKPDQYRKLFTESDEKQLIAVQSDSLTVLPLDEIVRMLKTLIPSDVTSFLPEFSTTTDRSRVAKYAAFADAMSPYYNYGMFACGIPSIRVDGTRKDWQKIATNWSAIASALCTHVEYFYKSSVALKSIVEHLGSALQWKTMFNLERCGSGSQTEVSGWITDLFLTQPKGPKYVSNFASHLSKVEYEQLQTKRKFVAFHGLLFSTEQDGLLLPDFGQVILEQTAPKTTKYKEPTTSSITFPVTKSAQKLRGGFVREPTQTNVDISKVTPYKASEGGIILFKDGTEQK